MKPIKIISVMLCISMLVPGAAAQESKTGEIILSSEDFSAGMQDWTSNDKNSIYVINGEMVINNIGSSNNEAFVFSDNMSINNGELEFDINVKKGQYFAAYFRYADEGTHYVLRFYPDKNKIMLMKKIGRGSYVELKHCSFNFTGKNTHIRISLINDKITVYAGSNQLFSVLDTSIKKGKIGFAGLRSNASVDNVKIAKYDDVDYEETKQENITQKIFVSCGGDDKTGDGSIENPYRTIDAAKNAVKKLKRKGLPIDVVLRGGVYRLNKDIVFNSTDGGSEDAPVRYISYEGEQAVLSGAARIDPSDLKNVKETMKKRLKDNVKEKVRQIDLKKYGITDEHNFIKNYSSFVSHNIKPLQVTLNGAPQSIARYPNYGYNRIVDCQGGKNPTPLTIYYTDNIPTRWTNAKDMFIEGLFANDWHSEWSKVDKIDITQNSITTEFPTAYGANVGGRWAAVNLIEELDIPGEWYIDFDTLTMYYYPPYELGENDSLEISTSVNNIITVNGAEYLTLEDLKLTMSCDSAKSPGASHIGGNGIYVYAGSNNILIKDCEIVNIGMHGVFINTNDVTVDGCTIRNTGFMGVDVRTSGDRDNLIPGNVAIRNCDISEPGRDWTMTSSACIMLEDWAVDVLVENNVLHNTKNAAIRYNGVGHTIRNNEIYCAVVKAADAGAVYAGRNWTQYGVKIEYNFFHDIGQKVNEGAYPASALFWDDQESGGEFSHNISVMNNYSKTSAVKIGGGTDCVVKGNTFVASEWNVIGEDRSPMPLTEDSLKSMEEKQRYSLVDVNNKAYKTKYPKMSTIVDRIRANNMMVKTENEITDNLTVDCPDGSKIASTFEAASELERNVSAGNDYSIFVNPDKLDFRVTKEAKAKYKMSEEILDEDFDIEKIGIQNGNNINDKDMTFIATYPENNSDNVSIDRTVLAWQKAPMADRYEYTVATDENLQNVVANGTTENLGVTLEGLEKGKTYYWKVTAENMSRQNAAKKDAENGVMKFSVSEKAEINTAALKSCIETALSVAKEMKEGTQPGEYKNGSTKQLKELIKEGQKILQKSDDQAKVDDITYRINYAIKNKDGYINTGYQTLNLASNSAWVTSSPDYSNVTVDNGSVRIDVKSSMEITLDETLPNYNVMCFKTKVDSFDENAWFAYGLRAIDAKTALYNQDAYYILIKKDVFELQKHGVVYEVASNDGKFDAGKWHELKFGSITTENGINMYFELDGEVIFDYLDKTNPQYRPGKFAIFASTKVANGIELAASSNIPETLYEFSDKILEEIKNDASSGGILDVSDKSFVTVGNWKNNDTLKGNNGSAVMSAAEPGASAAWSMESGSKGNNKVYKVSYYNNPTDTADKNVKIKISGYGGEYETTVDLTQGVKGWVPVGTFNFIDADYIGRLKIEFIASGEGELNVSNVKFELETNGENMFI